VQGERIVIFDILSRTGPHIQRTHHPCALSFFTWQTCHAIRPIFDKAASSNPQAIFVDVPVLESNSNLHQGLGVKSIPFGLIFHPEEGLIEEKKLSRKTFSEFEGLIKMHSYS
jgi:hypothetical protein